MKSDAIQKLVRFTGSYAGRGVNHEGQPFEGSLVIASVLDGSGVSVRFKATGDDGTVFHEEFTTIAPTLDGNVGLFNLNTNMPGLVPHVLARSEQANSDLEALIFAFGEPSDSHSFREEITIELHRDRRIGYKYAWGLPGGSFADRSAVVMTREGAAKSNAGLLDIGASRIIG